MTNYSEMTTEQLLAERARLLKIYRAGLSGNMHGYNKHWRKANTAITALDEVLNPRGYSYGKKVS